MPQKFKRKAYAQIKEWKDKLADKYALLIEGARRVGKTHLVQEFVGKEYELRILTSHTPRPVISHAEAQRARSFRGYLV